MRIYSMRLALLLSLVLLYVPILNTRTLGVNDGVTAQAQTQARNPAREALIERAKSFELNTPYVPPPGDPLEHEASGYAKIMCSSVFITGLDPAFARSEERRVGKECRSRWWPEV